MNLLYRILSSHLSLITVSYVKLDLLQIQIEILLRESNAYDRLLIKSMKVLSIP